MVSQVRSIVELSSGKKEEAVQTQKDFLDFTSKTMDKIPGLGHAKAMLHTSFGEHQRGEEALRAARRSSLRSRQLLDTAFRDVFGASSGGPQSPPGSSSTNR